MKVVVVADSVVHSDCEEEHVVVEVAGAAAAAVGLVSWRTGTR